MITMNNFNNKKLQEAKEIASALWYGDISWVRAQADLDYAKSLRIWYKGTKYTEPKWFREMVLAAAISSEPQEYNHFSMPATTDMLNCYRNVSDRMRKHKPVWIYISDKNYDPWEDEFDYGSNYRVF